MSNLFFKKLSPKKLFHRLILIFFIPLIITQLSVVFFFYERHWDKILNRFANIAANQITVILNEYQVNGWNKANELAYKLNLVLYKEKEIEVDKETVFLEKKIAEIVKNRIKSTQSVNFSDNQVIFSYKIRNENLKISFPRKYLSSETPIILFLWMISISLILSIIAFLFLRIQIRAIQRLAISAEEFGKGKEIKPYKPTGAMEIRQAGNAFLKMKRRINSYLSQRTSFLAGISHDLGTIITRIKLRLELLKKTEDIDQIKNDIEIMQSFLKEYLDFSEKISISKITKINLLELMNEVIKSSNSTNKKTILNCSRTISVYSDRSCLYRIIFNLYENALKFGKAVKIKVKKQNKFCLIFIEDDGPGIPSIQKKKIFKPFYKVDDSRNLDKGGSGLGLSIASELAKKIKAKISLETQTNVGSIFMIKIPLKI